jgi:hypothetical protein
MDTRSNLKQKPDHRRGASEAQRLARSVWAATSICNLSSCSTLSRSRLSGYSAVSVMMSCGFYHDPLAHARPAPGRFTRTGDPDAPPRLIVHGAKRVENRTWATPCRKPLVIHAGRSHDWLNRFYDDPRLRALAPETPDPEEPVCGAVIGQVELVDCVSRGQGQLFTDPRLIDNPWATGPVCWILENARPVTQPVRCPGRQGLWEIDESVLHTTSTDP